MQASLVAANALNAGAIQVAIPGTHAGPGEASETGTTATGARILADAAAAGSPDAIRLQAALAMREGNLSGTWKYLEAFLKATGRGNWP